MFQLCKMTSRTWQSPTSNPQLQPAPTLGQLILVPYFDVQRYASRVNALHFSFLSTKCLSSSPAQKPSFFPRNLLFLVCLLHCLMLWRTVARMSTVVACLSLFLMATFVLYFTVDPLCEVDVVLGEDWVQMCDAHGVCSAIDTLPVYRLSYTVQGPGRARAGWFLLALTLALRVRAGSGPGQGRP